MITHVVNHRPLRENIARLADLACEIDVIKNSCESPEDVAALREVVAQIHRVAARLDKAHGVGIYDTESA